MLTSNHRAVTGTATPVAIAAYRRDLGRVAVVAACAIFLVVAWQEPVVAALVGAVMLATAAAVVDACTSRLPDELLISAFALAVAAVAAAGSERLAPAALGALVLAGPLLLLHLVSPTSMGFGDVKLAVVLGTVLGTVVGVVDPRAALVALCIGSGVTSALAIGRGRAALPFGPGLVLGVVATGAMSVIGDGGMPWR